MILKVQHNDMHIACIEGDEKPRCIYNNLKIGCFQASKQFKNFKLTLTVYGRNNTRKYNQCSS